MLILRELVWPLLLGAVAAAAVLVLHAIAAPVWCSLAPGLVVGAAVCSRTSAAVIAACLGCVLTLGVCAAGGAVAAL